jgi:hypothetical protein
MHYGSAADSQQQETAAVKGAAASGKAAGLTGGSSKQAAQDTVHTLCTGNGSPYQVHQGCMRFALRLQTIVFRAGAALLAHHLPNTSGRGGFLSPALATLSSES